MFKLLQILIFFITIAFAYSSDCIFSLDLESKPIFIKKFGTRKVLLPKNTDIELRIRTDEVIEAFCENGFRDSCNERISSSHIELKCNENKNIYYSSTGWRTESYFNRNCGNELKCADSSGFQLFESNRSLSNCEPNMSLGVGIQVDDYVPIIYAGICYDWNNMNLKYVNYMAYRSKSGFLTHQHADNVQQINSVTLDDKLDNIQDYFNLLSYNDSILNQFNFEKESLLQDVPLKDDLKSVENLLQIIWWRNLRLANWRTFLNLLEERSRDVPYYVSIGSSGEIIMPTADSDCKINKTLSYVSSDNKNKAVPAYIWLYLKSAPSHTTEDVVVIAYNSPFYYNDPSIYLCQDICDEFEWLHSFQAVRKMATLGLIYCCRPQDVAQKLNNFPYVLEQGDLATASEASTDPQDF